MYLLSRRWGAPGVGFLMTTSFTMAVLATGQIILTIVWAVTIFHSVQIQVFPGETLNELHRIAPIEKTFAMIQLILCSINVATVDCLFLYRCYAVWNYRKNIIVLPALFIAVTLVVNISWATNPNVTKAQVAVCLAMVTNLILTALTAGRILYLGRLTRLKLVLYSDRSRSIDNGSQYRTRSKRAIAIILESGAIYCAAMIFLFIMTINNNLQNFQLGGSLFENFLNIIPTFTIVYVGLNNQCTNPAEP
ncbi:hypothetical protein R3P38DRAFT_1443436 [Favolaschia claudopus]|uniref:Uncharacterized protein n=1 Tax=Favolaschia claudopus TaxID=2862362 RepID=A0AAW0AMW7_9AGAR